MKPSTRHTIKTWPSIGLDDSSYNGSEFTVFYVHGWSQNANDSRLDDLKDVILNNVSDIKSFKFNSKKQLYLLKFKLNNTKMEYLSINRKTKTFMHLYL